MERRLRELLPDGFQNVSASRSRTMGRVKSRNNKTTEVRLRMALIRARQKGWILHPKLLGNPDFFFKGERLAVFVDGCFWHGCNKCGHIPKTRSEFWQAKIRRNRQRDKRVTKALKSSGVKVLRVWEHSLTRTESLGRIISKLVDLRRSARG
jgi:DNA mismatch endonuclease (patch repair protein)